MAFGSSRWVWAATEWGSSRSRSTAGAPTSRIDPERGAHLISDQVMNMADQLRTEPPYRGLVRFGSR